MSRPRRRQRGSSRAATIFFLVGCLAVLGTTFGVGLYTGRYLSWASAPRARLVDPETRPGGGRGMAAETAPTLTFYRELTAPLGAPPPPAPRPRRTTLPAARPEPAVAVPEGAVTAARADGPVVAAEAAS
ncbi:MAG: hypothetical protein ACREJG_11880, partial [Candidatus Rokuibacteriota bacterium]